MQKTATNQQQLQPEYFLNLSTTMQPQSTQNMIITANRKKKYLQPQQQQLSIATAVKPHQQMQQEQTQQQFQISKAYNIVSILKTTTLSSSQQQQQQLQHHHHHHLQQQQSYANVVNRALTAATIISSMAPPPPTIIQCTLATATTTSSSSLRHQYHPQQQKQPHQNHLPKHHQHHTTSHHPQQYHNQTTANNGIVVAGCGDLVNSAATSTVTIYQQKHQHQLSHRNGGSTGATNSNSSSPLDFLINCSVGMNGYVVGGTSTLSVGGALADISQQPQPATAAVISSGNGIGGGGGVAVGCGAGDSVDVVVATNSKYDFINKSNKLIYTSNNNNNSNISYSLSSNSYQKATTALATTQEYVSSSGASNTGSGTNPTMRSQQPQPHQQQQQQTAAAAAAVAALYRGPPTVVSVAGSQGGGGGVVPSQRNTGIVGGVSGGGAGNGGGGGAGGTRHLSMQTPMYQHQPLHQGVVLPTFSHQYHHPAPRQPPFQAAQFTTFSPQPMQPNFYSIQYYPAAAMQQAPPPQQHSATAAHQQRGGGGSSGALGVSVNAPSVAAVAAAAVAAQQGVHGGSASAGAAAGGGTPTQLVSGNGSQGPPLMGGPNGHPGGPQSQQLPLTATAVLTSAANPQVPTTEVIRLPTATNHAGVGAVTPMAAQLVGVISSSAQTNLNSIPSGSGGSGTHHTRRRRQHALEIIDPHTNKNILDDLELSVTAKIDTNSDGPNDFSEPQQQLVTTVPSTLILQQQHSQQSDHHTQHQHHLQQRQIITNPSNTDLLHSSNQQHLHLAISQTPIVSAMSDAPSVEIFPSTSTAITAATLKPARVKKILPIVPPPRPTAASIGKGESKTAAATTYSSIILQTTTVHGRTVTDKSTTAATAPITTTTKTNNVFLNENNNSNGVNPRTSQSMPPSTPTTTKTIAATTAGVEGTPIVLTTAETTAAASIIKVQHLQGADAKELGAELTTSDHTSKEKQQSNIKSSNNSADCINENIQQQQSSSIISEHSTSATTTTIGNKQECENSGIKNSNISSSSEASTAIRTTEVTKKFNKQSQQEPKLQKQERMQLQQNETAVISEALIIETNGHTGNSNRNGQQYNNNMNNNNNNMSTSTSNDKNSANNPNNKNQQELYSVVNNNEASTVTDKNQNVLGKMIIATTSNNRGKNHSIISGSAVDIKTTVASAISTCDEPDRASTAIKTLTFATSSINANENDKPASVASITTIEKEVGDATGTSATVSPIYYNEGQWSPLNPNGRKQYNREQLLQLREAELSRKQPRVNNTSILPQPNLMPSFMKGPKRVQSMVGCIGGVVGTAGGGSSGGGGRAGDGRGERSNGSFLASGGKQSSMSGIGGKNMILLNLSLNQYVKLNETDNAWRPRHLAKADDEVIMVADPSTRTKREKDDLIRRVRGILNKLTPEKFDTLVEEIIKLKIDTPDKMEDVMVLVFEKAIDEPNFSVSYARLCHRLITEVKARDERMESGTKTNLALFRNALLDKTEREFTQNVTQSAAKEERLHPIIDRIKNSTDLAEKAELELQLEEEERKIRRRSGGTVRFIGELFKISMLTGKIIYSCIDSLLNPQSEDMLECLCKLLTTVGAKFEQTPINSKEQPTQCYSLEKIMTRMQAIASKSDKEGAKVSSRVRFMLQDVIDLRKNKWQSTRNEAPKTMEQIEKEAKTEQLSAQYLNYGGSLSSSGAGGGGGVTNSNNISLGRKRSEDRPAGRYGDDRGATADRVNRYGGSHSQRGGDTGSIRRGGERDRGGERGNDRDRGSDRDRANVDRDRGNSQNDDNNWIVQTSKGNRSVAVDTNKLEGLQKMDVDTRKMGGVSQFLWNTSRHSSQATTIPTNSFAPLSALVDGSNTSSSNDRGFRGSDRKGGGGGNSYNKSSIERDRYDRDRSGGGGSIGFHSRAGSATHGSRESSTTHGCSDRVCMRGIMSSGCGNGASSLITQKSSSQSKYQLPTRGSISGKQSSISGGERGTCSDERVSSSTHPSARGGGVGGALPTSYQKHDQPTASNDLTSISYPSVPPIAIFEKSSDSDLSMIKSVVTELLESVVHSKAKPTVASTTEETETETSIMSCIQRVREHQRVGLIYYILTDYLHLNHVGPVIRRHLAVSLVLLIERNFLSVQHFRLAYGEFCTLASDLIFDIPALWQYIFEFCAPLMYKKLLTIHDLWTMELRESIDDPKFGQKFLKTLLDCSLREIGPCWTRSMWKESNLKWTDFVNDADVKEFINKNYFGYIEFDVREPKIVEHEAREKLLNRVMERVSHLLKESANSDCIIDYINGNVVEIDKQFIRTLTETLCNYAIIYKDGSYKLETVCFQRFCIRVLQRYIDSNEECEWECLQAMLLLVHNLEHPRGLLGDLFYELYQMDVIPQETFIKWRDSKDQTAGKGVAVKALNRFFNSVLSGETSDENN